MKSILVVPIALLLCINTFGQNEAYSGSLIVYPTFEQFNEDSGITYDGEFESVGTAFFFGRHSHKFKTSRSGEGKRDVQRLRIKGKEVWGFKWGDALYRTAPSGQSMYVAYSGKVFYYELCDYRHVEDIVTPKTSKQMVNSAVATTLISESLTSALYVVKNRKRHRKTPSDGVKVILDKFADGKSVFNCLEATDENYAIRKCFELLK